MNKTNERKENIDIDILIMEIQLAMHDLKETQIKYLRSCLASAYLKGKISGLEIAYKINNKII
jgi:hypothetical protein